jgi:hypothetical protein
MIRIRRPALIDMYQPSRRRDERVNGKEGKNMANPTYEVQASDAASETSVAKVDMKFEIVVIPVSDVDRAKKFYTRLGWRLDADYDNSNTFA